MNKKLKKRVPMRALMLRVLAGAGVVSISILAPKLTRLLPLLDRAKSQRDNLNQRIVLAINRLEKQGLVQVAGPRGRRKVSLTEKGKKVTKEIEFSEYAVPEPAFWDGKWRVLMFDMSEGRRRTRDQLRRLLQGIGFVRLQDSVWVYPYPCDEFLTLVRAHLRSGVGELRSLTADALESDAALRKHFNL